MTETDRELSRSLPLLPGAQGGAVSDLQIRLTRLGYPIEDGTGNYGASTTKAVRQLQDHRGLHVDGICDAQTWSALVEAGYRLGDRPLFRATPMIRGDDVAELQRRLAALGFDSGLIDGIFGDQTGAALLDFQHNAGLPPDQICGRRTVTELNRLEPLGASDLVSPLRERLRVTSTGAAGIAHRHVGVGEQGGFAVGVASVARSLRSSGATVSTYHHSDPSRNAADANVDNVDCFINLVISTGDKGCSTAFYRGFRYESPASRYLAELVQDTLPDAIGMADDGTKGMALPILRETRMPAIEIRLGTPLHVVQHTNALAEAVLRALIQWIDIPQG